MIESQQRKAVRIVWIAFLLVSLGILFLALPGYAETWQAPDGDSVDSFASLQTGAVRARTGLSILVTLLSIALAVLIFWRKPTDQMAVFFSFYLLLYATFILGPIGAVTDYWFPLQSHLSARLLNIFLYLPSLVLLLLFPNSRFQPRWTLLIFYLGIVRTVGVFFVDGIELVQPRSFLGYSLYVMDFGLFLLALSIQVYRFFAVYTPAERQQVKWAFSGILAWMTGTLLSSFPYNYLLNLPSWMPHPWWEPLLYIWYLFSLSILPVAFAIAILRSKLWDIDILIRRTLQYALLTSLLSIIYFGGVALLQSLLSAVGGQRSSPAVVILTTLTIAALFNPLRRRVQNFIDRRFYRQKYDAELALADFAAVARSQTDLQTLTGSMSEVVQTALQPDAISVWIVPYRFKRKSQE